LIERDVHPQDLCWLGKILREGELKRLEYSEFLELRREAPRWAKPFTPRFCHPAVFAAYWKSGALVDLLLKKGS
jgi:hypothetical protein